MKANVWHIRFERFEIYQECHELLTVDGIVWGLDINVSRKNRNPNNAKLVKAAGDEGHKVIEIPIEVQAAFAIWSFDNDW